MGNTDKNLLEFGPFRIDPEQRLLWRDQEPISLSPKAFDLLLALVEHNGQVVLKDDLMKTLWPDTFVEESNLGQHVFQLRKALGERAQGSSYIVTIPGRGYRFAQTVTALPREEAIVVQSRSRSRMVIEEEVPASVEGTLRGVPGQQKMLPASASAGRWHRGRVAGFVVLGAMAGALGVWTFFRPLPAPRIVRTVQLTHVGRAEPYSRAVTDGARIYFTERMGGSYSLAQVPEQGGEPVFISSSVGSLSLFDIDRTRSRLLVGAEVAVDPATETLWALPTTGGSARRIGDVRASDAAWAPDGRNLAYCRNGELYIADDNGQQSRKLFTFKGQIMHPRWSPDGSRLSFSIRDPNSGTVSLWTVGSDGRDPHPILPGWKPAASQYNEGLCCGNWSPDGRYFIFRAAHEGIQSYWLIRQRTSWFERNASAPIQLYTSPEWISEPRFSADGKKIIFAGFQGRRELLRYDVQRKLFVPYLGGIPARHLSFSRDGQWVVYKNEVDGNLWRSRLDGSQALQLTFFPGGVLHSSWSPDGKKIVFGSNASLWIVPFEGGNPEQLTRGSQPSWSPDGNSILYTIWDVKQDGHGVPSLHLLNLATRQTTMIPGSEDFEGPQWSPDGRYAVASDRKDEKLMMFDFARQRWSELADGLPYGWGIRWSADSQYVYYQHLFAGDEQPIFRVHVSDRKVEQITGAHQILRADVLSYSLTGLTPDNSPLASMLQTNSDLYALELELP